MFGNNRKTIGVFTTQAQEEYQDNVCRGIMKRAGELDYNVAIFTNFGGSRQQAYDSGEFQIINLPDYNELDGAIITPDVMVVPDMEESYKDIFKTKGDFPVVYLRKESKDFYNVLIDDYTVLDEIIRHFIEVHKFTRINFLSGPKGYPDTDKRLANYKRVLAEYGIPIDEKRIYYGDLWRQEGKVAVEYWLNNGQEWPQAIICANDFMAITVCRALTERGISVPDQIAVTGCDDMEDAAEFSPSLTTARMPAYEMGMEAVDKIHKHNCGIEQPQTSFIRTTTIYRASCGCKRNWYHESNQRRRNHILARETLQEEIYRNAYMSTDLTGHTKLEEVVVKLWTYVYDNDNFSHFCLCLYNNWDHYHADNVNEHLEDPNDITMEMGYKNRVGYTKLKCSKKELIPIEFAEDRPMNYYFALLHHQEHCFGYVAISYNQIQSHMRTFQSWLINVSNALENIRLHGELNRLVYSLEDMSIRDDLTGLYNRRVLVSLGKQYLKRCVDEHSMLMVFTADMDKLKYINDKFGHYYGDIALKVVANALQEAADDDEICIRLGGDEFMAIGIDYDEMKLSKFIKRFVEALNDFNFKTEYDFGVFVSYGYKLVLPDAETSIEGCLSAADSLMYRQKYEKEANRIKANLII